MKKIILIGIIALVSAAGGIGYYMWNKPKTTAKEVQPAFIITADSLASAFMKNDTIASKQYVNDKVAIEISGVIDSTFVNEGNEFVIILKTKQEAPVVCFFIPNQSDNGNPSSFTKNNEVIIKGFCGGLNGELFPEVQMTKCFIRKK
ncbi:MAG: OB-fold protein [Bacteroidota bacterium]